MLQRVLSLFWKSETTALAPPQDVKSTEPINVELLQMDETFKKINTRINLSKLFHPDHVKKCEWIELLCINSEVRYTQTVKFQGQLTTKELDICEEFTSFLKNKDLLSTLQTRLAEWTPQQPLTILGMSCISDPNPDYGATVSVKFVRFDLSNENKVEGEHVELRMLVSTSKLQEPTTCDIINKYMFREWPEDYDKQSQIGRALRDLLHKENIEQCTQQLESLFAK